MKTCMLLLATLFLVSCGTTKVTMRSTGETASVNLRQGGTVSGELIALTDSSLFISDYRLNEIPFSNISSVNVDLKNTREWLTNVLLFEGLPSVIGLAVGNIWDALGADFRLDFRSLSLVGLVGTGVTALAFEASEPQTTFRPPLAGEQRNALLHYFRHPFRLSEEQLKLLRESSNKGK